MRSQRKKRLATAALEGAVAAGAGAALEGFGIVTLASLFPVLMVELLGIITSLIHPYDDVSHAWLPASRCLLQAAVCWPLASGCWLQGAPAALLACATTCVPLQLAHCLRCFALHCIRCTALHPLAAGEAHGRGGRRQGG